MAMYFVIGLIFDALASSRASLFSSNVEQFIAWPHSGTLITMLISPRMCIIGTLSLRVVDREICSASLVENAISVCEFDLQMIGQFMCLIKKQV